MSRSVTMPTIRSPSPTGRLPMSIRFMVWAASRMLLAGSVRNTSVVMIWPTFMMLSPVRRACWPPASPALGHRFVPGRELGLAQIAILVGVHFRELLLRSGLVLGGRELAVAIGVDRLDLVGG